VHPVITDRAGSGTLLRCRFDTFDQLSRHLHMVDNATLLFVRDQQKLCGPAGRVLVEFAIRESAQQTVARGEVVARAEGRLTGWWLQLSDMRLARRLREPDAFAVRREERVSADALVQVRGDSGSQLVAQLLDISPGGLRLRVASGLSVGEVHLVKLLGLPGLKSDLGLARVVRAEKGEASLRFALPRGLQVLSYIESVREAWRLAIEVEHPAGCCTLRGPIEPSPPRVRPLLRTPA
jgi:hypothetical protein